MRGGLSKMRNTDMPFIGLDSFPSLLFSAMATMASPFAEAPLGWGAAFVRTNAMITPEVQARIDAIDKGLEERQEKELTEDPVEGLGNFVAAVRAELLKKYHLSNQFALTEFTVS